MRASTNVIGSTINAGSLLGALSQHLAENTGNERARANEANSECDPKALAVQREPVAP